MIERLSVGKFLSKMAGVPILDVRSPCEYKQGHIPGSISFPLFSDEERKEVGTLYKQVGPTEALIKGLEFVGPKMAGFVKDAMALCPEKKVGIHCWRGGSRSGSMAILLELAGFEVSVLTGGYKAFRQSVLNDQITCEKLLVLGGYTGSGKTQILHEIQKLGHSVLDLEKLACHKGSVFGAIGEPPQPSQEQFENELYIKLLRHDQSQILWVEDESKAIGKLRVPEFFYLQIRSTKVFFIEKSKEARLRFIEELYGQGNPEEFEHMIRKLSKRLGGLRLKMALEALKKEELLASAEIVLQYYDEGYLHGLEKRESGTYQKVDVAGLTDLETAKMLLGLAHEFYPTGEKT